MLTPEGMSEMLQRLTRLPMDWDGNNSPKITEEAIASCKSIIKEFENSGTKLIKIGEPPVKYPVFLYPAIGGGLSFWMDDFGTYIIKILPDGSIVNVVKEENGLKRCTKID
jgi:hypothetical protein